MDFLFSLFNCRKCFSHHVFWSQCPFPQLLPDFSYLPPSNSYESCTPLRLGAIHLEIWRSLGPSSYDGWWLTWILGRQPQDAQSSPILSKGVSGWYPRGGPCAAIINAGCHSQLLLTGAFLQSQADIHFLSEWLVRISFSLKKEILARSKESYCPVLFGRQRAQKEPWAAIDSSTRWSEAGALYWV